MDFGALLHAAKKNSENVQSKNNKFYSTKFAPPKKESKAEKKLSDNIKKFLEKKEKEEREKAKADKEKVNSLISMRDEKSKNKIRKMLKVTKSANRSVLDDVDPSNSAVIEDGLVQPDEDDYGYVSNAAAELFKKYVDKVGQLPEEKRFSASRPATIKDLSSTKDRVKAAIIKEQEEKSGKSKSTTSVSSSSSSSVLNKPVSVATQSNGDIVRKSRKDVYDPQAEKEAEEQRKKDEQSKKAKLKSNRTAPPPIDFQELLKLAEKKQFEPVDVKVEEINKESERPLTKKEKQEMEERKKYLEEKELRKKLAESGANNNATRKMQPNGKIPKINSDANNSGQKLNKPNSSQDKKEPKELSQKANLNALTKQKPSNNSQIGGQRNIKEPHLKSLKNIKPLLSASKSNASNNNVKNNISSSTSTSSMSVGKNVIKSSASGNVNKSSTSLIISNSAKSNSAKSNYNNLDTYLSPKDKKLAIKDIKPREFPLKDIQKTREFPPKDVQKTREVPLKNIQKTREFPPKDIQKTRQFPPPDIKRAKPEKKPIKRRILDDDEYDSEMDDFIDDGPEEEYGGGYSKYIKEIFGYDKSRYRDDEFDDSAMESSFSQQMREETISKKIGLLEDLEDMKQEAKEKKLKIERMKKMRHK